MATVTTCRHNSTRRRIKQAIEHRGDLDGTLYLYYDGSNLFGDRSGSEQTVRQYVWGTQHIDEIRRADLAEMRCQVE